MAGTKEGGLHTKETVLAKYGEDYYKKMGSKGGSVTGIAKGFALFNKEKLLEVSRRGGKNGKRGKSDNYKILDENEAEIMSKLDSGMTKADIILYYGVSAYTLRTWLNNK